MRERGGKLLPPGGDRALIGADVSRAKRKTVIDQLAAVMILESYLARNRA